VQLPLPPVAPAAVRDTVTRLLEAREYDRALRDTLWSRIVSWVGDVIGDVLRGAARAPLGRVVALVLVVLVLASVIGRALLLAQARRRAAALAPVPATPESLRAEARALAAQEAYAEAAHLLHAAIVTRLATEGRLVPHPSRTIGDHARALRRGDQATWRAYRDFGRRYEVVLYGDGRCDATRWATLESLAAPLLDAPPRVAAAA
jgi:hypothetical protein